MYDIIRQANCFDIGRIFGYSLGNTSHTLFRSTVFKNNTGWASQYSANEKALTTKLADIVNALG